MLHSAFLWFTSEHVAWIACRFQARHPGPVSGSPAWVRSTEQASGHPGLVHTLRWRTSDRGWLLGLGALRILHSGRMGLVQSLTISAMKFKVWVEERLRRVCKACLVAFEKTAAAPAAGAATALQRALPALSCLTSLRTDRRHTKT